MSHGEICMPLWLQSRYNEYLGRDDYTDDGENEESDHEAPQAPHEDTDHDDEAHQEQTDEDARVEMDAHIEIDVDEGSQAR